MAAAATSRRLVALAAVLALVVSLQAAVSSAAAKEARYTVGGADGWRVPPPEDKERFYANWASNITFYVDDSVEFVYKNDSVIKVGKAGYYHCNETAADAAPRDGTTLFVLDAPGPAYFASADLDHCSMGQRLMVDVLADRAAPGPWASGPSAQHSAAAPSSAAALLVPVALAAGFV
ncbi:mavicyanin-like [Panicum miliaceum]|uniref:Mavicyanin-like n=1 Tax=Panicum miliaceum TaxID=4540 RepID=A0A3L6RQ05_PANMI|nr:mavicyanin-like [Panicum miliaceum]